MRKKEKKYCDEDEAQISKTSEKARWNESERIRIEKVKRKNQGCLSLTKSRDVFVVLR